MKPSITSTAVSYHIAPGMTPKVFDFVREIAGPRLAEHEASRGRLGITTERVWIEPTNEGDMLIFYFEGPDIERSLMAIGESVDLHDIWFREKVFALTGADLCDYRQIKAAELVFESSELGMPAGFTASVFHVQPGKLDQWRTWVREMTEDRREEYTDHLSRYGLTRECFYLRHRQDQDTVILYAEGEDPAESLRRFARSNHPFDVWMRQELLLLSGIDFIRRQTAPPPHLVLEWVMEKKAIAA